MQMEEVASGLEFPEGPIAMADGSVVLVEIKRKTLSRVESDGTIGVIAELGGGPNGAAVGPDGAVYVCNNGGMKFYDRDGLTIPGGRADDYSGGRIERVDLETGAVTVLYTACEGKPLNAPNDIVFDRQGGFWFTDLGSSHDGVHDEGAVYYAKPDGSFIKRAVYPIDNPNGIGLSPDETVFYVASTNTGRLWAFDIAGPGEIKRAGPPNWGRMIANPSGLNYFDSLAVDADGNVCVATIFNGGITSISPDGSYEHFETGDFLTTNICFGGEGLRTAYITLSSTGRLVKCTWPRTGLPLNYLNT